MALEVQLSFKTKEVARLSAESRFHELSTLSSVERKLFLNGKPTDSSVALKSGDFCFAGEIIVMSVLQGGPAPSLHKDTLNAL
jgi:hypothetical protein